MSTTNKNDERMSAEEIRDMFASQKVVDVDLKNEMKSAFIEYAMSVIVSRALPDVRDGLKPIHRRIIYTMYEDGITPDHGFLKSVATVGDVMGKYHPHGDAAIYDSMVRLAQKFSLRYPLIQGQGNFGNVDGDPPAAMRYTESRMSRIAMELVRDIEKETVEFVPSFDGRNEEPSVLPSRFPNLLVNGSSGIAVGMATSIPPHNLGEVIDGVIYLIENPDCTIDELIQFIKGPDFPTGGEIMGLSGIRAAYHTGRGKIQVRGKATIEDMDNKGRKKIVVTEIPYMVNKSKLIQDIADHVNDKRIEGVSDIRDESDKKGMSIVIELKRDANPTLVLNKIYSYTQLQDTCSVIMLALVNGEPKILNLKHMLDNYLSYQKEVIVNRTKYDLKKAKERAHILEGLLKALDHIDEIVKLIRSSENIQAAKEALMSKFGFSDIQSQKIVDMRLGQLTGLERNKLLDEFGEVEKRIDYYMEILNSEKRVLEVIKEELLEIKEKYGDERKTNILPVENDIDIEDLIENKTCVYTFTNHGYIKRQPEELYKVQRRGGRGVSAMTTKEEDYPCKMFIGDTHNVISFFTNKGRLFIKKGYEIPESSRNAMGMNIVNLLELTENERITTMIPQESYDENTVLNMITRKGQTKRCSMGVFKNIRKSGINAIGLDEDDELVSAMITDGKQEIIVVTHNGMAIRYNEEDVTLRKGRTAGGNRAIRLAEGDYVIGAEVVDNEATLFSVTEKGYGKRTSLKAFNIQYRGGKGHKAHKLTEKNGLLSGIKIVQGDEDAVIISQQGVLIRIKVEDVPVYGRTSCGVRIMKLKNPDDDSVISIATLPHSAEETETLEIDAEDAKEALVEEAEENIPDDNEENENDISEN